MSNPYGKLDRALDRADKEGVREALAKLSDHEKDLLVECRGCGAKEREECRGTKPKIVHFGRRVARLLALWEKR